MIDKKIEEILQKVHDSAVSKNHDPRLGYSQKAVEQLKSLFKEYTMEIINTKVKSFGFDKSSQEMGAEMLRAEQREKLLTITEDKK